MQTCSVCDQGGLQAHLCGTPGTEAQPGQVLIAFLQNLRLLLVLYAQLLIIHSPHRHAPQGVLLQLQLQLLALILQACICNSWWTGHLGLT